MRYTRREDGSTKKPVAFVIRDDDVNYFTQPWMLEAIYHDAWMQGFKVSLAVIPNVEASSYPFIPEALRSTHRSFKISQNEELIHYLLEKAAAGNVDIVQHGYTHSRKCGMPEFLVNEFKYVNERLKIGNRILRNTFKRNITVFVAPHEKVSRATWKSLSQNRMCLSRRFTLGRFVTTAPLSRMRVWKLLNLLVRCPNPLRPIPDSIVDLADVPVIQWDAILSRNGSPQTQLANAMKAFHRRRINHEVFVILHHHWEYFVNQEHGEVDKNLLSSFNRLLSSISVNYEVWKTTLSELHQSISY